MGEQLNLPNTRTVKNPLQLLAGLTLVCSTTFYSWVWYRKDFEDRTAVNLANKAC